MSHKSVDDMISMYVWAYKTSGTPIPEEDSKSFIDIEKYMPKEFTDVSFCHYFGDHPLDKVSLEKLLFYKFFEKRYKDRKYLVPVTIWGDETHKLTLCIEYKLNGEQKRDQISYNDIRH